MAQRSSNLVLAGAAAGHGSVTVLGECHHSRCASKLIAWFLPGGLALLNAASDAFVAAPTPAAAPSLRGSNAAIAQAPHDMIQGRRSEFLCLNPYPLSLVHCPAESIGYSLVARETCQILANLSH